jgi:hypothetical protein
MPYLKHRCHKGFTPDRTINKPAKYLPGTTPAQIQAIETTTVQNPSVILSQPPGTAEYVRPVDRVIGWDNGHEATISFVECNSRYFHGRPMAASDPKLRGTAHARDE